MRKQLSLSLLMQALGLVPFRSSVLAQARPSDEKAPTFTLKLLDGGEIKSSELAGKIAVLKFVASY